MMAVAKIMQNGLAAIFYHGDLIPTVLTGTSAQEVERHLKNRGFEVIDRGRMTTMIKVDPNAQSGDTDGDLILTTLNLLNNEEN